MKYEITRVESIQPYPSPINEPNQKYVFVRVWVHSEYGNSREFLVFKEKQWKKIKQKGWYEK